MQTTEVTQSTTALPTQALFDRCLAITDNRLDFWVEFIRRTEVRRMVEIGVYEGDFAAEILKRCPSIEKYYMLDPWRHLPDWNKPYNSDQASFERIFETAKAKTDFAGDRRVILRGTTKEVIDEIADQELDFAYIDGDHTLRGITIDLVRACSKIKPGGFIGGDDFSPTPWYHSTKFEPTLVFPFAVYFAEAFGASIYALPHMQFCMQQTEGPEFKFVDLTGGHFGELSLRGQLDPKSFLKRSFVERFPRLSTIAARARRAMKMR